MALIRLAYISRATFRTMRSDEGVEPSVARILAASRRNNLKQKIVGGLYYGDGYFFQYLEGEKKTVFETFERIKADSRHSDVRIVLQDGIDSRRFQDWSMKYVPLAQEVERLLRRHKMDRFDPYAFTPQMFEDLIHLIQAAGNRETLELTTRGGAGRRPLLESRAERHERLALITAAVVLVLGVAVGGFVVLHM